MLLFVQRQIARKNGGGWFSAPAAVHAVIQPPADRVCRARRPRRAVGMICPAAARRVVAPYECSTIFSKVISLAHTACFMDREMRFFFASTSSTTTFTTSPTATASEGCRRNRLLLIWEI